MNDLYHEIIASTAEAVIRLDPVCEIKDMVVDSSAYRNMLKSWVDPDTNLNVLQIAIAVGHIEAAKFFSSDKFTPVFGHTIWDDRGDVVNPPLHLACKVGILELIQYFVEERHCDLTSKAVVTYDYPTPADEGTGDRHGESHDDEGEPAEAGACGRFSTLRGTGDQPSRESHQDDLEDGALEELGTLEQCCVSFPLQTPYEVSVDARHVLCANYLCEYIINNMDKPLHPLANSSLLHHAAYLGSAEHLRLLLENGYEPYVNERDSTGHMPVHVAALTAEADCLRVLMEYGASLNARADHRSCLHIMYWSKFRPEKFYACTQVIIL